MLTQEEKLKIAEEIANIEFTQGSDATKMQEIEKLITSKCSIQDLLDIDEIIMEKYLTD